LIDKWNEVVLLANIGVFQQALHRYWNERQYVSVKTDDHAVKELSNSLVQRRPLDRHAESV